MAEVSPEQRQEAARALLAATPLILAATAVWLLILGADIFTGFLVGDRRFDFLALAASVLGLWGLLSMRRIARRVVTNELPVKPSSHWWVGEVLTSVAAIGVLAGMGYLLGGPWLAITAALFYPAFMAIVIGLWVRKQRRERAAELP